MLKYSWALDTKALEAGVNKIGSEIGTRAANKVISTVSKKFSNPPKEVKTIVYKKEVESDNEVESDVDSKSKVSRGKYNYDGIK